MSGAAKASLKKSDAKLLSRVTKLYEEMIDIGAHPNIDAIELMTTYDLKPGEENGMVYFSHLADPAARHLATMNVIRAADQILCIAMHIWPDRYQNLGVRSRHQEFRDASKSYIESNNEIDHRRFVPPSR